MPADTGTGRLKLVRPSGEQNPTRVLLLHGLGTNWRVWNRYGDPLNAHWGVSDPPVQCLAERPDPEVWAGELPWKGGDNADWARHPDPKLWIAEAINAVPDRPDIVVAHSFAATMLLELATGPIRDQVLSGVRGLVLVSPFYKSSFEDFSWGVMSAYLNGFVNIMAEGIRVNAKGRPIAGDVLMAMAERVRDRVGPYGWMRFFETYLRTPEMRVEDVDIACQIITGTGDIAAPPSDGRTLADRIPYAGFTLIDHCGHFPMIEAPAEFGSAIEQFNLRIQPQISRESI